MRRLLFAVVAIGVVFNTGVSLAQEKDVPQMPEKVRGFLDNLAGTWKLDSTAKGITEINWDPGMNALIDICQSHGEKGAPTWSAIWHWDGESKDGIIVSWSTRFSDGISIGKLHGRVLSETTVEGEVSSVDSGKVGRSKAFVELKGTDKYIWKSTNRTLDGRTQPDQTASYTRVKTASDEQELIELEHELAAGFEKRNLAVVDRINADDITVGTSGGTFVGKDSILNWVKSDKYNWTSMTCDDLKAKTYGDMAVVTGKIRIMDTKGHSTEELITDVFSKRDGQWQMVATHSSKVSEETQSMKGLWELQELRMGEEAIDWENRRSLKVFQNGTFMCTTYDTESRLVESTHGGNYSFDGKTLKETVTFVRSENQDMQQMQGQTFTYEIDHKGGTFLQIGEYEGQKYEEVWSPVSASDVEVLPDAPSTNTQPRGVTRKDFEEFCKLAEGVWSGDILLASDIPDVGNIGDIVKAIYDYTIVENGAALIGKAYWPEGTETEFYVYDDIDKKILVNSASPVWGTDSYELGFKNRTWTVKTSRLQADGKHVVIDVTAVFSNDGNTFTVTGSSTVEGETSKICDVWHRLGVTVADDAISSKSKTD